MPRDEAYVNPVDGMTYAVGTIWHTHKPATHRPKDPTRKVNMETVWLLTPERLVFERASPEQIIAFLSEAERLAEELFRNSPKAFRVRVRFTCAPDGHKIQLKHINADPELLQAYYEALVAAEALPVRHDEVRLAVDFSVRA